MLLLKDGSTIQALFRTFYLFITLVSYLITMCELNAILIDGKDKTTLMEDVVRLAVDGNEITITGIFGDTMTLPGRILHVDMTKNEALIENID